MVTLPQTFFIELSCSVKSKIIFKTVRSLEILMMKPCFCLKNLKLGTKGHQLLCQPATVEELPIQQFHFFGFNAFYFIYTKVQSNMGKYCNLTEKSFVFFEKFQK